MEQNMTNPSVRSLPRLFVQTLCPLSVSINYTVQLNLVLVAHRDSFHTKMQFSPRFSALPNGPHRISVMVSGWFPGDKLITMAIIRGSHPIEGQGKIHGTIGEAYLIISEGLSLQRGCYCRSGCARQACGSHARVWNEAYGWRSKGKTCQLRMQPSCLCSGALGL